MQLKVVFVLTISTFLIGGALAQQKDSSRSEPPLNSSDEPVSSSEPPAKPTFAEPPSVAAMAEPEPGDYWTFENRDEITGKLSPPVTTTVTEVTPTEISVRLSAPGGADTGFGTYDRSWNQKTGGVWKYSPNDGQGFKLPLQVGASWSFKCEAVDSEHGFIWVRNGSSKVLLKDKIMTKAGLFETLLFETTYTLRRPNDNGNANTEITARTWYSPEIDHWVRRTVAVRTDHHLRNDTTVELIAYGRKQ